MTEQTFPESPRNFLYKVSMSLSHYHSHIQPLEKQLYLFREHTHTKKRPWNSHQLPQVWCGRRSAHWQSPWVCFGFWMCRASEISSSAAPAWREAQGTSPGHSVLPAEMDTGQGTKSRSGNGGILSSSQPCHPKPRHLTGSRVCNSI